MILNILSLLLRFIPKNKYLWVTGKITSWTYTNAPPAFFDNSKYFYLYLVNHTNEKVYWLTSSNKEFELLQKMNLPVVKYPTIKGRILVLCAKFSFHHYGPNQIDPFYQQGSIQLDFWHGTPLKKIRYDVVGKPKKKNSWMQNFVESDGEEYVFSTSKYLSKTVLEGAFALPQEKFVNVGYPRMDIMGLSPKENREFCERYSPELLRYINIAAKFEKVFLYMPTFRDDDPEYYEKANIDFETMNAALKKINGVFFLKLHPLTKYSAINIYSNIIQIDNDVDIYPFLTHTNFLVTDYSSIYFDYLLLDREIIFIPYDYANYVKHRELYFDYKDITPGVKYSCFQDFIDALPNVDQLNYSKERKKVRDLMIENYNFDACKNAYEFMRIKYR